jgi:predicted HAD superfamily hydrolase
MKTAGYEHISFDIFDTLIKRNVRMPSDIFDIIEITEESGFKNKRIEAERAAREKTDKGEIRIEDIYEYFPPSDRSRLIRLELDTELKASVPNIPVVEVFKRCIDEGKTVYITSDMYWPKEAIERLLERNGITGYKKLYLSSEELKTKAEGSLYEELLKTEGITGDKLLHIGDNLRSDYLVPKRLGIASVHIPGNSRTLAFRGEGKNKGIQNNYIEHFINNTFNRSKDPYYQFGYSQFGRLLYGFVNWIHDGAVKEGIKKLFFFARDGYIMKQAFELCFRDDDIETEYLEVSRRSLRVPVLWTDSTYETVIKMVVNAKLVSIRSIFDGLGLDISGYSDVIKKHNFNDDTVFDRSNIFDNTDLKGLIEELRKPIVSNSVKEYENLKEYLAEKKVYGKFGVVDIGYGGSMQRYLQQALRQAGSEFEVTGFYLGVADFHTKHLIDGIPMDMKGYLFDFKNDPAAVDSRKSFVGLFETLFLEREGSVKSYIKDENGIRVERYPYEYSINGQLTDDCIRIRELQRGALDFVSMAVKDEILPLLDFTPMDHFEGIYQTGTDPAMKDLRLFGDIMFYDEGIACRLAAPGKLRHYLTDPGALRKDFLMCRWKTGFMKRLFKIKLPYYAIYRRLSKYR